MNIDLAERGAKPETKNPLKLGILGRLDLPNVDRIKILDLSNWESRKDLNGGAYSETVEYSRLGKNIFNFTWSSSCEMLDAVTVKVNIEDVKRALEENFNKKDVIINLWLACTCKTCNKKLALKNAILYLNEKTGGIEERAPGLIEIKCSRCSTINKF